MRLFITGLLGAMMSKGLGNASESVGGGDIFVTGDPHTKEEWD